MKKTRVWWKVENFTTIIKITYYVYIAGIYFFRVISRSKANKKRWKPERLLMTAMKKGVTFNLATSNANHSKLLPYFEIDTRLIKLCPL